MHAHMDLDLSWNESCRASEVHADVSYVHSDNTHTACLHPHKVPVGQSVGDGAATNCQFIIHLNFFMKIKSML